MKHYFKKLTFIMLLTLLSALMLGIFAEAEVTSELLPLGVDRSDPDFVPSGYSDVDEREGWIMITTSSTAENVIIEELEDGTLSHPKFCYGSGYRAYFHERMGKLVYIITGYSFSGNWGDEKPLTGEMVAAGKANRVINVDEAGARYMHVYWNTLNADKIKTLEFRLPIERDVKFTVGMNNPGYATWGLTSLETVLFDYRIAESTYLRNYTSPFNDAKPLISSGHVEFNTDGSVNQESERNTYLHGEVNLSGMTKIGSVSASTNEYDFGGMLDGKSSVTRVVFFRELINRDGIDMSYRVPKTFFKNCTSLKEVVFPARLGSIGEYSFQNCKNIKLYLAGGFSEELSFDLSSSGADVNKITAFKGAKNITFCVNTYAEIAQLRAILDANGITEDIAKVETADGFEPALLPIGYTARTEGYNGVRGLFSFRPGTEAHNTAAGYTVKEYGVMACSLDKYNALGGTPESLLLSSDKKVKRMIVFGASNSANKYVDSKTKTFCLSVKNLNEKNYSAALCIVAYEKWTTPNGDEQIFFASIKSSKYPNRIYTTLYDETKYLADSGAVNESSAGYSKIIKPVLDSVIVSSAQLPNERKKYIL